jgi:hypothetical protein
MILAELIVTTEIMIFFGVIISAVISVLIYLGTIDRRVTILENRTITRDEFYQLKDDITATIRNEIKKI